MQKSSSIQSIDKVNKFVTLRVDHSKKYSKTKYIVNVKYIVKKL